MDDKTFQLRTPIARGETDLTEVTLRGITTEDYIKIGPAYDARQVDGGVTLVEKPKVFMQYIIRLGALTEREVYKLDYVDFKDMCAWITQALAFRGGSNSTT